MSQPHPWTQQDRKGIFLNREAARARAAYLRRWSDRIRSYHMAGVTDQGALAAASAALAQDRQDELQ